MAQIKIEITYDPSKETLEQAVSSLTPKARPTELARPESEQQGASAAATTGSKPAEPTGGPTPAATAKTSAPAKTEGKAASAAADDSSHASHPSDATPKKVSKTDVRAIATALSKAGKREELAAIFAEFGGKKLSDIKEEDYPALMERLVAANG